MLRLETIKRTDSRILQDMSIHYSQPKGFVGRNICYAVLWNDVYYGAIVGGSATKFLPGRNEYFGSFHLNEIVNNIFYHIEPKNGYPCRNFTVKVLSLFRETIIKDWKAKYNNNVLGFESLVELPRTGEVYKRDKWELVGQTVGYTCKRIAGKGTDSWSGKRVWNTNKDELRPKLVFCRKI